jgi:hypothetical protein
MNAHISIPPTAADAYRAMLNEGKNKMSEDQHKQIARDLYKKYGYDAHSIGDLMQELVILKGKFESEKKRKPSTNTDPWYEPDRSAGPRGPLG